jgi:hypothetical protein
MKDYGHIPISTSGRTENAAVPTDGTASARRTAAAQANRDRTEQRRHADCPGCTCPQVTIAFLEKLPEPEGKRGRYEATLTLADQLRANPGRWAAYPFDLATPHYTKWRVENGRSQGFGHGFEGAVRDGTLFVRYIGVEAMLARQATKAIGPGRGRPRAAVRA